MDFKIFKSRNLCGKIKVGFFVFYATISQGEKLKVSRYRRWEKKLVKVQRAKKKNLTKTIHAKIKNSRKDAIEKFTTKISKENSLVVVGKIESKKIIKTKMVKSTYDNGWFFFKTRLSHKVVKHGGRYIEVNEHLISKTCRNCGIGWNFLKGLKSLAVREYICSSCGFKQDRDINAARNILRIGHDLLSTGGIPH
jgi:IS605 OrfB family transposase